MSDIHSAIVHVRPFALRDREAVLGLAARLTVGAADWLDPQRFLVAARGWVQGAIEDLGSHRALFVAEDVGGRCVSFVGVARGLHFTGVEQAYVGELVVAAEFAGMGVGRRLVTEAESWARHQGCRQVALDTGASNVRARGFYARLGYREESVKLVKVL